MKRLETFALGTLSWLSMIGASACGSSETGFVFGGAGGSSSVTAGTTSPGVGGTGGGAMCSVATDCPDPGSVCLERACVGGSCGPKPKSAGTSLETQTPGDCQVRVCDGIGGVVTN